MKAASASRPPAAAPAGSRRGAAPPGFAGCAPRRARPAGRGAPRGSHCRTRAARRRPTATSRRRRTAPAGGPLTIVERVEDVVQQNWFINVLQQQHKYDSIVVLAHMDCIDPLVDVILQAIRNIIGPEVNIVFITGHSHRRAYQQLDPRAVSFEAGHFLDTIGLISFSTSSKNPNPNFRHIFLDATKQTLRHAVNKTIVQDFDTIEGTQLTSEIYETQQALGLYDIVGCSSHKYHLEKGYIENVSTKHPRSSLSLWWLYLHEIIPNQIFKYTTNDQSTTPIFIQGTGAFRYTLFDGGITKDDIIAVCPFNDSIYKFDYVVFGHDLLELISVLETTISSSLRIKYKGFPSFGISPPSENIEPQQWYQIFVPDFDYHRITPILNQITNQTTTTTTGVPQKVCIQDDKKNNNNEKCLYTTNLWMDYVTENMPCLLLNDREDRRIPSDNIFLPTKSLISSWSTSLINFLPVGILLIFVSSILSIVWLMWRRRYHHGGQKGHHFEILNEEEASRDNTTTLLPRMESTNRGYGSI